MSEILEPEVVATKIVITGSTPGIACSGAEERRPVYAHELAATLAPHLRPLLSAPDQAQAQAQAQAPSAACSDLSREIMSWLNTMLPPSSMSKGFAWRRAEHQAQAPSGACSCEQCTAQKKADLGLRCRICGALHANEDNFEAEVMTADDGEGVFGCSVIINFDSAPDNDRPCICQTCADSLLRAAKDAIYKELCACRVHNSETGRSQTSP